MNAEHVNPFLDAFKNVMGQLGFANIKTGKLSKKGKEMSATGVMLIVGIVGEIKGNVVYVLGEEDGKKIASKMMMGMPVAELDDMAKSAISELSNMLTANAATSFSNSGVLIDISAPTFLQGKNVAITMSSDTVIAMELIADDATVEVNISFNSK